MITRWFTPDPVAVDVGDPVDRCRSLLDGGRIRHLPVTEGGWFVGMLDEVDVRAPDSDGRTAGELAARACPSVAIGASPRELLEALQATEQDVVAITDGGRPAGVFTEHDAVGVAARELPDDVPLGRYMTRSIAKIEAEASVRAAREQLATAVHRHLVVVHQGELYGALSWRDLVGRDELDTVAECVGSVQWRLSVDDSVRAAAATMARHHIGMLPVLDDEAELVGLLTRTDVIVALLEHLD